MSFFHKPVLLKEIVEAVNPEEGQEYIDATLGGGGHSFEIVKRGGKVLGIDRDNQAIESVRKSWLEEREKLGITEDRLRVAKGNFSDLKNIAHLNNFRKVRAIIFDLGVSSHQIDEPERGFSFLREGPLDMRMDRKNPVTAELLVNTLEKGELNEVFHRLGQERLSWAISDSIVRARKIKAIRTTRQLSDLILETYGIRNKKVTDFVRNKLSQKVFQALRIAVNNELENLEKGLSQAVELVDKKGRVCVITFHSLEDGIVKRKFKELEQKKVGRQVNKKPILPRAEEIKENARSRSAKLRIFEKI